MGPPNGQPTRDPFQTGGLGAKQYRVGRNVDNIWEPKWNPYEIGGQKPYGHIWVAHMGPYSCPDGSHVGPCFFC